MPSMEEIYERYAPQYDELVDREDHEGNLALALHRIVDWTGADVVESGIGTGRVSRTYLDNASSLRGFDRAAHMLKQAAANLAAWREKVTLAVAEHLALPVKSCSADVFVEGWAFGHPVVRAGEEARVAAIAEVARCLVAETERVTIPGGSIVIIETLGTNAETPGAPLPALDTFYRLLESEHGFSRETVPTDYLFPTADEAICVCGFFFGEQMADALRGRFASREPAPEGAIVPEYTGIWHRTR